MTWLILAGLCFDVAAICVLARRQPRWWRVCIGIFAFSAALFAANLVLTLAATHTLTWSGQSWRLYDGTGALGQRWAPSHVTVKKGALTESVSGGVAGGASDQSHTYTYGTFQATIAMTAGAGNKYVLLLCAKTQAGTCRPEIDWAEDPIGDTSRTRLTATLHYGVANHMIHRSTSCTCTQPTIVGVRWQRGLLVFTRNGHAWATIRSPFVPTQPMRLAIQTAQTSGTQPATLTTTSLEVP